MPKKVKLYAAGVFLALTGILCLSLLPNPSLAETDIFGLDGPFDGDGWSLSADKTLTIESNQGWWNAMKHGFSPYVNKLIIGKDLTDFRLYFLPDEVPSHDFFNDVKTMGYDRFGKPYYDYFGTAEVYPQTIQVEAGNPAFYVVEGLLINKATNELVLSEMGVTDVVIPEGVSEITREAFSERDVRTVQFPSTLEVIGLSAFAQCDELEKLDFPESVTQLKDGAFGGCKNLRDVSLPSKLTLLGSGAFSSCPIQSIEIPETVEEIGARAFSDCDLLHQVILHAGLKKIGHSAFSDCKQLMRIEFPEGLKSIGEYTFYNCDSLRRVILPDSLEQIGDKAFSDCNLSILRIPASLAFPVYDRDKGEYIVNPNTKKDKTFDLSSVDTVIFSGSDYDFGYPAINNAKNVYFLGKPPEDVRQILDRDTTGNIYCSEEYEHEWTRSTVASWVRQKLTILPADQLNEITQTAINTTPRPIVTPRPTPTATSAPANTPQPAISPTPELAAETNEPADPLLFVFAGILALVIAGIVVVAVRNNKTKKHARKRM
ncbi:MAG: leucine-rich repeat protein [Christensenella sp.]|nr:leucine-rich repeat protein [Christensenella sp.]